MRKILLLIVLASSFVKVKAQVPSYYNNLEKYWYYRYRLVNDFMKIGDNAGESIPAIARQIGSYCTTSNCYKDGGLTWGADATVRLGTYMQVLATEYYQLQLNGKNTDRTKYELEKAVNAILRLDKNAEHYCTDIDNSYPPNHGNDGGNNTHNGFFIRDDVPYLNFIQENLSHFNRNGISFDPQHIATHLHSVGWEPKYEYEAGGSAFAGRYGGAGPSGYPPKFGSSHIFTLDKELYHNYQFPPSLNGTSNLRTMIPRYPYEESQDQLVEIFKGLALTNMYVSSLKSTTSEELFKLINYIGDNGYNNFGGWTIRNPLTRECVYGINPSKYIGLVGSCDAGGGVFITNAEPAVEAVKLLTGTTIPWSTIGGPHWAFELARGFKKNKDIQFTDAFVCFADNWRNARGKNVSFESIKRHADANETQTPHLPLLYKLIRPSGGSDKIQYHPNPSFLNLLDNAPPCGPYYYWNQTTSTKTFWHKEWSGGDRLVEPYHRQDVINSNAPGSNESLEFNGLDYMLLFNLYALVQEDYVRVINNPYYETSLTTTYPENHWKQGWIGTKTRKLKLNYLEYLGLQNKIESDGDVTFRGGKVIEMNPGFEAKSGSNVFAYIQDYTCAGGYNHDKSYHHAFINSQQTIESVLGNETEWVDSLIEYGTTYVPRVYDSTYTPDTEDSLDIYLDSIYADSLKNVILTSGDSTLIGWYYSMFDTTDTNNYRISGSNINSMYEAMQKSQQLKKKSSISNLSNITIHPNPTTGQLNITMPAPGDYDVKITNMLGVVVYQGKLKDEQHKQIQLENNLPSGNYTVQITGKEVNHIEKITLTR